LSWLHGVLVRARLLFGRGAAESRMEEELRFHLEMETERLVREAGLAPEEAARRARVAFGSREKYREEMRDGRGLAWLSGLRLDLKLGVRMLLRYPVLTLAGVLAIGVAVALAAAWFEFSMNGVCPRIPLPEAGRLVALRNLDLAVGASESRSLHDYESWREELTTVEELTAVSSQQFNVMTDAGRFASLRGARVTASMFRLAGIRPLLGRTLTDADYRADAAPVVVLGHSAWRQLFDGDRSAIGRTVRLGAEYATVVGVMPERFAFPLNHELWTPLRESAIRHARREGPSISMYGRLASGTSLDEARAQLELIGQRAAVAFPETHEQLRPEMRRFGRGNDMAAAIAGANLPFLLFLIVVSANVATLFFARTATRGSELAMRSALGASRRRIVVQLVAEALVLTSIAAALGLAAADYGLRWGMDLFWQVQQMKPPFWWSTGVSPITVLYGGILAVIGAAIIGGVPGLRATRHDLRHRLARSVAGGSGLRFGAVATGVVVVQVALCVAFIPVAILAGRELLPASGDAGFPAHAYLTGRLMRPFVPAARAGDSPAERREGEAADPFDEVHRRLAALPGVLSATRASRLPGFNHPTAAIGIEGDSLVILRTRLLAVDPDFFDVVGARVAAGRPFRPEDATSTTAVAIVDEAWARDQLGGGSPIGRRFRYPAAKEDERSRWYEVVGVVAGMDRAIGPGEPVGVYVPLRTGDHASVQFYLRTATPPAALVPQVHDLVASIDPALGFSDVSPLDEVWRPVERSNAFFAAALATISAIILLFALIGIYALMSFTVAQRAREIGIRAAMGADPRRIIIAIFSRALGQIALGILAGAALVSLTATRTPEGFRIVAGVAAAMVVVGLLGCVVPAIRALRIQPIEALRAE